MQYQLKNWKQNGSVKDNGDGTSSLSIMAETEIVGDTYGFVKYDAFTSTLQNNQDIDEQKTTITNQAIVFVAKKYPNT